MFVCLFNVMPASLAKLYQVFQIYFCQKQLIHVGALCLFKHKVTFHFIKPGSADATIDRLHFHSQKNNQKYASKNRLYTFMVCPLNES